MVMLRTYWNFLAHGVMHIPDPGRHVTRSYGACSSVVRARRRREATVAAGAPRGEASVAPVPEVPPDPELRCQPWNSTHLI